MTETDPKLQPCVKWLVEAAQDWERKGLVDAPIVLGAASPRAAQFVRAEGWPDVADTYPREEVAAALIEAVELPPSDTIAAVILAAVSLLLGDEGRQQHLRDVTAIRGEGKIPVLLFMVASVEIMATTTTGIDRPTLH